MRRTYVAVAICFISGLHAASKKPVGPLSLYQQCAKVIAQSEIDNPETYAHSLPPEIRKSIDAVHLASYATVRTHVFRKDRPLFNQTTREALALAEFIGQTQEIEPSAGRTVRSLAHHGITQDCMFDRCAAAGAMSCACGLFCGGLCCGLHNVAIGIVFFCISGTCFATSLTASITAKKWNKAYLERLLPDYTQTPQPMTMDLE
jgi:hypothetical protein